METVKLKKVGTLPLCLPCRPYYCSTTFPLDKPIPLSILGDWSNQIYPYGYNGMSPSYKTKDSTPQENKTYYIFKNNKYQSAIVEDFTNGKFNSDQTYYEEANPKIIKFYYIGEFTGDIGIVEPGVKAIKFFATIDGEITDEVTGVVLTSYIKNYYWDNDNKKGYIAPVFKYANQSFPDKVKTEGIEVNKNAIDLTKIPKSQLPWYEIRFTRRQYSENNSPQGMTNYQTFTEDGAAYDSNISKINAGLRYSDTLVDISYPASYCRKFEPVWKKIPESIFNWNIQSSGDYSLNPQIDLFSCSYNLTTGDFDSQYIGNNEYALTERYQIPTGTTNIKINFNYTFYRPDLQVAPIEYNKENSGGLMSNVFNWISFSDFNNDTTCKFNKLWYNMDNGIYSNEEITEKNKKRLLSQRISIFNNLIILELNSGAIQNVFPGAEIAIVCYTKKNQGESCGFLNMGENSQKSPYLSVEDDTTNSEDINKIWKSINVQNDENNNWSIDPINFKLPDYNNKKIQDIQIYLRYHSNKELDSSDLLTRNNNTLISVKNFIGSIEFNSLDNSIQDFRLHFQGSKQTNTSLSLAQILQANIIGIEFYKNDSCLGELTSNSLNQLGFPTITLSGKHQPALNIAKDENDFEDYTFKALKLRQVNESSDFGYILEVFKEDNSSNETKVNIQIGDLFQFKKDSKYLKINNDNDNDNDNDIYNINNIYIIQKLFENNKIAAFSYCGGNNNIAESSKKIIGLVDINTITLSNSSIEVKPSLDLLATQEDYKQLFCDLLKIKCADYVTNFYDSNSVISFNNASDNFYFSFPSSILSNIADVRKWEQTCQTFWNIFYSLLFFFGYDVYSETLTQSEAKENLLANYNFTNLVSAEAEQLSDIILSVLSKTQIFIIDNKRYSFHQNFYQLRISKNKIELAYLEPQDNPQKVETTSNTGIEENQQNISSSNATNTSEN